MAMKTANRTGEFEGVMADEIFRDKYKNYREYLEAEQGEIDVISLYYTPRIVAITYDWYDGHFRYGAIFVDNELVENHITENEFASGLVADRLLKGEFE